MTPLERRYRLWLLAYPDEYRREHETEMLGTLLDAAEPGQEWPSGREIPALLAGGLRTRARLAAATPRRMLADGLRLGAVVYLALACAGTIGLSLHSVVFGTANGILGHADLVHLEAAVLAAGVVALAGAAYEIGIAAMAGQVAIQAIMFWNEPPLLGGPIHVIPAGLVLVAATVAALAWHPSLRPFRRPWSARLTVLVLAAIGLATLTWLALDGVSSRMGPMLVRLMVVVQMLQVGPAGLLLLLAVVGLDPRPALAATVYAGADAVGRAETLAITSTQFFPTTEYELSTLVSLATLLAALLAVAVLSARRRAPT